MGKFSISEAVKFGWEVAKNNIWLFVKVLLLFSLIFTLFYVITMAFVGIVALAMLGGVKMPMPLYIAIAWLIISFILGIVSIITQAGFVKIALNFCYGQKSKVADLFSQRHLFFKYLFAIILFSLPYVLYDYLISSLLQAPFIRELLLFIPAIIWLIRLQFYPYFIVDKGLGPIESLRKSWQITKGATWSLIIFYLVLLVINFLGFLALIIGIFWTFPASLVAHAFVYKKLVSQSETPSSSSEPVVETPTNN